MIQSIAWKNVWRNRKRSLIVITAIMLGTTAGVFTSGLMKGWVDQRIDAVIFTEVSHIKLYHPDFLNNEEIGHTIPKEKSVTAFLDKHPGIKAYSKHIKLMVMASTSRGNTALMLNGIDVEKEKQVSQLYTQLLPGEGTYFEEDGSFPIIISDKTAELLRIKSYQLDAVVLDSLKRAGFPESIIVNLMALDKIRFNTKKLMEKKVTKLLTRKEISKYGGRIVKASEHYRLRSKIVFTFTDKSGELVNQTFRVCGVFKTTNTMFDQMNAFVLQKDLAQVAGLLPNEFHEITMLLIDGYKPEQVKKDIRKAFPEINVLTWKELVPDAGLMSEYMTLYYYIIMGFILFALAFGIINTMLMAILERTKEIGMLMAIGMNKNRVFNMIMLETIFLTMVGAVIGMGLGWLLIVITGHTGLNFSGVAEGLEAMGWSAVIYPSITASFFFGVTLMVVATGILSSIAPARKALSLNPVDALRSDN